MENWRFSFRQKDLNFKNSLPFTATFEYSFFWFLVCLALALCYLRAKANLIFRDNWSRPKKSADSRIISMTLSHDKKFWEKSTSNFVIQILNIVYFLVKKLCYIWVIKLMPCFFLVSLYVEKCQKNFNFTIIWILIFLENRNMLLWKIYAAFDIEILTRVHFEQDLSEKSYDERK